MFRFCVFLIFYNLIFSFESLAQSLVYVKAGKIVDVESDTVLENQLVVIKGERILSVIPWVKPPMGAKIIDWSDYTVLPGLIDGHTHLVGDISSGDIAAPLKLTFDDNIALGKANAKATLLAGFTSVVDVGSYMAFTDVAVRDLINSGKTPGPRMQVSGPYITITGGGGEVAGLSSNLKIPEIFRKGVADNEEEIRQRVRELIEGGVDHIKVIATGAVLTSGTKPGEAEYTESEIRAAVEEAAKYGKFVTAHAHGVEGIKNAIRAGVRSIQHGSLMDDEAIEMMKEYGTWLVADIFNGDYINEVGKRDSWPEEIMRKNKDTTEAQRNMFRKAVKVGINISFGTDSGVYPHGLNAKQMLYMVKYGFSPMEAIKSATIWGAKAMSKEKYFGSITVGKYADLIAVKGNVLEDISILEDVKEVIKGGVLYLP
jgi:imidazolonepropionase-like amidohydrolase